MNAPVIQLSALSKRYDGQHVLAGLDWPIASGQVIGLLGRNGSGKSTLLGCLLGIVPVDGGTSRLFGENVDIMPAAMRAQIGYVPQSADLFG